VPTKAEILKEIRRLAVENGGTPVGRQRFFAETGIRESDWLGRYWSRWNDAVEEAGLEPNDLNVAQLSEDEVLRRVADLVLELGRFPTVADRKLKRRSDPQFPSHNTIESRLGQRQVLLQRLVAFSSEHDGYGAVAERCAPLLATSPDLVSPGDEKPGYVYLIRMDKWYKLGCTTDILRRRGEIRVTLPDTEHLVHSIETDDPFGIERYWHQRFADRRTRGEWFVLTWDDVRAFKRWRKIF
jgi:hypothetical protein